jgi:DNA-binding GntR family transcriptional regulator
LSFYTGGVAASKPSTADGPYSSLPPYGRSGPDRLARSSLSDQIAARLRNDIVHGRICAGTHLVQDELCARFGTSRMPVRDALQQLTHEGILEQNGSQRIVVHLGVDDMEDVHTLVAVLHGWAAGRAAHVASESEITALAEVSDSAHMVRDPYEFGRLAMDFHRRINQMAHSTRLIRTLVALEQTVPRTAPFNIPDAIPGSKTAHRGIVAALQTRDAELAEHRTRANALTYVNMLLQSLQGRLPC